MYFFALHRPGRGYRLLPLRRGFLDILLELDFRLERLALPLELRPVLHELVELGLSRPVLGGALDERLALVFLGIGALHRLLEEYVAHVQLNALFRGWRPRRYGTGSPGGFLCHYAPIAWIKPLKRGRSDELLLLRVRALNLVGHVAQARELRRVGAGLHLGRLCRLGRRHELMELGAGRRCDAGSHLAIGGYCDVARGFLGEALVSLLLVKRQRTLLGSGMGRVTASRAGAVAYGSGILPGVPCIRIDIAGLHPDNAGGPDAVIPLRFLSQTAHPDVKK